MAGHRGEDTESRLELLLQASRPLPDRLFVEALEERLLAAPRSAGQTAAGVTWYRRPAFVGAASAAGLAAVGLALALAGGGPLAPGGDDEVKADDSCRYVTVEKRVRTPVVTTGPSGEPVVRYRSRLAERRVKRCR
jgi:hypothetical protein